MVSQWITERRLERAWAMLDGGSRVAVSVADVGFAVGFKNTTHFSRVFEMHYGISPREHRLAAHYPSRGEAPCHMRPRAGSTRDSSA